MQHVKEQARPARPKDAASLIIYRPSASGIEVLLGRRASESRFMPDVFVYPGGVADISDSSINPATPLPATLSRHMAVANQITRATTLANAAIRETFEETGLMLASPGEVSRKGNPPPPWQPFHAAKRAPNLACLHYIGRAITPTSRPLRFHARFFAVNAAHLEGEYADSDELQDVGWYAADDTSIKVVSVTRFMLDAVVRLVQCGGDNTTHAGGLFFTHRRGKLYSRDDSRSSSNGE